MKPLKFLMLFSLLHLAVSSTSCVVTDTVRWERETDGTIPEQDTSPVDVEDPALAEDGASDPGLDVVERDDSLTDPMSDSDPSDAGDGLDDPIWPDGVPEDQTDDGSGTACTGDEVPQPNTSIQQPAGLQGCPAGMAPISGTEVCIDRWEAFLVEVLDGGEEAPWSPYFNPGDRRVRAMSAPGAVPQGYINQLQAEAACEEAGKRLCTREEWEAACRGPSSFIYPYGNTRQPGVCNDARSVHPVVEYFGTSDPWIWSQLGHPCINQLEDSLDPTGANPGCISHDGMCDMMGNLHEWIDDPQGTFKGGFYVDTVINGEGCLYTTTAHNVYHWDYSTGFRCCVGL